jgi:hypothetical protein
LVHELSHSFTLGDEYGEPDITTAHPLFQYTGTAAVVDDLFSNLQSANDVLTGGSVDGTKIKWRWHRISKSGIISGPIVPSGNEFRIPVRPRSGYEVQGHFNEFALADTVFLRFRNSKDPLKKTTRLSPKLIVTVLEDNLITVVPESSADLAGRNLVDEFLPGCIIYKPIDVPLSPPTYPYEELIRKNVIEYITAQNRPLTGLVCAIDERGNQGPDVSGLSHPGCKKHTSRLIGLYSGGMTYHCGVYHPAGICNMRNQYEEAAEFCAICRYVLVDLINPSKHAEIDRDYEELTGPKSTCC